MKKVYYNKLIRDLIADKIESKGDKCSVRPIKDDTEFQQELLKKIIEEAGALARTRSRKDFLDEYADLMMVLDALTAELEISPAEIQLALEENIAKKGKYLKRNWLEWSEDTDYQSNESPQGIIS